MTDQPMPSTREPVKILCMDGPWKGREYTTATLVIEGVAPTGDGGQQVVRYGVDRAAGEAWLIRGYDRKIAPRWGFARAGRGFDIGLGPVLVMVIPFRANRPRPPYWLYVGFGPTQVEFGFFGHCLTIAGIRRAST